MLRFREFSSAIGKTGLLMKQEDTGLELAYWALLPGNHRFIPNAKPISSKNFACLTPMASLPSGEKMGNYLGQFLKDDESDHVITFPTIENSEYDFSFHEYGSDVGHTQVIGPTGVGQNVVLGSVASSCNQAWHSHDRF